LRRWLYSLHTYRLPNADFLARAVAKVLKALEHSTEKPAVTNSPAANVVRPNNKRVTMTNKYALTTGALLLILAMLMANASTATAQVYELRTYTTMAGKLDNLQRRFRDHTVAILTKHGMKSVGYWRPLAEQNNTLIYVLEHSSQAAATLSWQAFLADPAWQQVSKESQLSGRILAQAPESVFMQAAAFSPSYVKPAQPGVFELRTYRTHADKLSALNRRFQEHTIAIFNRFGMTSVAYWHPLQQPEASDTLIYILRHDSLAAAKTSWAAFLADSQWQQVAAQSQLAGPILRARPESVFMTATDYSAIQ
jgi:hypothetical protein